MPITCYGRGMEKLSVTDVDRIAAAAHADQVDKAGRPYIAHPRAVAAALAPFGPDAEMAGLLHDVIEDTSLDADALLHLGVPEPVVYAVVAVSRVPGKATYMDKIRAIAAAHDFMPSKRLASLGISEPVALSPLVKLADNAHNSRADRQAALDPEVSAGLLKRYARARALLLAAIPASAARLVLKRINPALLTKLPG